MKFSASIAMAPPEHYIPVAREAEKLGYHAIVLPDADIENTVSSLMGAAYGSCGERCMAISVAVAVGDDTADELVSKLKQELAGLKVGNGCDNDNDMGPLVTGPHRDQASAEEPTRILAPPRMAKPPVPPSTLARFPRVSRSNRCQKP